MPSMMHVSSSNSRQVVKVAQKPFSDFMENEHEWIRLINIFSQLFSSIWLSIKNVNESDWIELIECVRRASFWIK